MTTVSSPNTRINTNQDPSAATKWHPTRAEQASARFHETPTPITETGTSADSPRPESHWGVAASRALALLQGPELVVSEVARAVVRHRVLVSFETFADGVTAERIAYRVADPAWRVQASGAADLVLSTDRDWRFDVVRVVAAGRTRR
jgi:hypothetical protein